MKQVGINRNEDLQMGKNRTSYILTVLLLFLVILEIFIIILQRNQLKEPKEIRTTSDVIIKDLRYRDSFNAIPVINADENEAAFKYGEYNIILFYLSSSSSSYGAALRWKMV